jgi:hypothetical protein
MVAASWADWSMPPGRVSFWKSSFFRLHSAETSSQFNHAASHPRRHGPEVCGMVAGSAKQVDPGESRGARRTALHFPSLQGDAAGPLLLTYLFAGAAWQTVVNRRLIRGEQHRA